MLLQNRYLTRTLRIRHAHGPASAIMICLNGVGYLVTARHAVAGIQADENIQFRVDDGWDTISVGRLKLADHDDIAVLTSPQLGNLGLEQEFISPDIFVGQAVAYCGFPLGLEGSGPPDHRWPIPLVKSAIYSGSIHRDGQVIFLFDTLNNKGFSGGPIFAADNAGTPKLVAIVSGYHFDRPVPVMRPTERGDLESIPDLVVQPNSGFMKGVPIARALELIAELEHGC
ncbi:MAG: hypothetical protein Q8J89_16090 [Caulobacter sp.]|nr:hypothetical protein [Caulobacter sp.]